MHGTAENVEKILGSIQLPACPAIMQDIMAEARKDEPDFNLIARMVGNDPGLSAAVLKLANSPAFRRNSSISSIPQAVSVLGLKKIMLAVNALYLRNSVSTSDPAVKTFLEKFWDKSNCTAEAASMLAKALPGISSEDAYTVGLFHDSGVPVLMQRFPDHPFEDTLHEVDWESIHRNEEARLSTNHAVVGNMLARNWGLPVDICQTIRYHHDLSVFTDLSHQASNMVRSFIAVLILAEHMASVFMGFEEESAMGQLPAHAHALHHIGMEPDEFHETALDILGEMRQYRN